MLVHSSQRLTLTGFRLITASVPLNKRSPPSIEYDVCGIGTTVQLLSSLFDASGCVVAFASKPIGTPLVSVVVGGIPGGAAVALTIFLVTSCLVVSQPDSTMPVDSIIRWVGITRLVIGLDGELAVAEGKGREGGKWSIGDRSGNKFLECVVCSGLAHVIGSLLSVSKQLPIGRGC